MNNISVSSDITQRELITPTEVETLPCNMGLLVTQGGYSYIFKKVAYYSDRRFMDKAKLPVGNTREELLQECQTSRVLKDGDYKWWEDFSQANNLLEGLGSIGEMDFGGGTEEIEIESETENENGEIVKKGVKALV